MNAPDKAIKDLLNQTILKNKYIIKKTDKGEFYFYKKKNQIKNS